MFWYLAEGDLEAGSVHSEDISGQETAVRHCNPPALPRVLQRHAVQGPLDDNVMPSCSGVSQ